MSGRSGRGCGPGRRRSRRWRYQTADRASRSGEIRWVSSSDCFQGGYADGFRAWFRENERDNIGQDELVALKKLAAELLAYDDKMIARVVSSGVPGEVKCDEKTVQ